MEGLRRDTFKYVSSIEEWAKLIETYSRIKKTKSSRLEIGGMEFYMNYLIKLKLIKYIKRKICRYNKQQTLDNPIRNIFTGEFVSPGNPNYYKTLKICRIKRIHSTCKEILENESETSFIDPLTGERINRSSQYGEKLVKKCKNRKSSSEVY